MHAFGWRSFRNRIKRHITYADDLLHYYFSEDYSAGVVVIADEVAGCRAAVVWPAGSYVVAVVEPAAV